MARASVTEIESRDSRKRPGSLGFLSFFNRAPVPVSCGRSDQLPRIELALVSRISHFLDIYVDDTSHGPRRHQAARSHVSRRAPGLRVIAGSGAWLRELGPQADQQVLVHRSWSTVVAVADGRNPVSVFWSDGDAIPYAVLPGAVGEQDLTPQQVGLVVLGALNSVDAPAWLDWRVLLCSTYWRQCGPVVQVMDLYCPASGCES